MAWSVLQSASGTVQPATSTLTVTFTAANASAGTKLLAVVASSIGTTVSVTSVQDAALNSMTQVAFLDDTADGIAIALYAMDTPAGDVGIKPAIKVTTFGNGDMSMLVLEVAGLAAGNTLAAMADGTAVTAGFAAGASHAQPAYSSTAAGEFLVAALADNGGPQTVTQPSGYALAANSVTNNSFADAALAYKNSSGGAETGTWTFGGSTTGTAMAVVAFKVAGGGAAPPLPVTRAAPPAAAPPAVPPSRLVPVLAAPAAVSDSDAAAGSDAGEAVVNGTSDSETASAAEAGQVTASVTSADAASAADGGEQIPVAALPVAQAPPRPPAPRPAVPSSLVPVLAPAGLIYDAEAAAASDAGEQVLAVPQPAPLTARPGAAWASRYGLRNQPRPQAFMPSAAPPPPFSAVSDSDDVHAEDSGFAALADSDAASAADGGEAAAVTSAEASSAAEAEKTAWPQDRDAASAAEAQHWSGPLSDPAPEQARAADGAERLALASAEASAVTDAAPVVEVYSFQPPFRWTGGGFELVWHAAGGPGGYTGITVWRGPLPDGAAFRVWKVLSAASRVILVTDADAASAREEHDPAIAGVSVSVAPAVTLHVQAG